MKLTSETLNDILLIQIQGKLNRKQVPAFKEFVLSRLTECSHLIFNLEEMTMIDHYGLDALLYVQLKALDRGFSVKLARILPDPRVLFDITEAYKVFDIYENTDSAIESCGAEQP